MAQYFSSARRKELPTQNSISSERILQEWREKSRQSWMKENLLSTYLKNSKKHFSRQKGNVKGLMKHPKMDQQIRKKSKYGKYIFLLLLSFLNFLVVEAKMCMPNVALNVGKGNI